MGLEEALNSSLYSKAYAFLDQTEDITVERQGRWIKIIEVNHKESWGRYYGFNKIDDVPTRFLRLGWFANKPGSPLERLATASL